MAMSAATAAAAESIVALGSPTSAAAAAAATAATPTVSAAWNATIESQDNITFTADGDMQVMQCAPYIAFHLSQLNTDLPIGDALDPELQILADFRKLLRLSRIEDVGESLGALALLFYMIRVPAWESQLSKPVTAKSTKQDDYEIPWFRLRGYYVQKPANHGFAPLAQRIRHKRLLRDASSPVSRVALMLKHPLFGAPRGKITHSWQHLQLLWRLVYVCQHSVSLNMVALSPLTSLRHACTPNCLLKWNPDTKFFQVFNVEGADAGAKAAANVAAAASGSKACCFSDGITINHYTLRAYCFASYHLRQDWNSQMGLQCTCEICTLESEWYKDLNTLNQLLVDKNIISKLEINKVCQKWIKKVQVFEHQPRTPSFYRYSILCGQMITAGKAILDDARPCVINDYAFHSWGRQRYKMVNQHPRNRAFDDLVPILLRLGLSFGPVHVAPSKSADNDISTCDGKHGSAGCRNIGSCGANADAPTAPFHFVYKPLDSPD